MPVPCPPGSPLPQRSHVRRVCPALALLTAPPCSLLACYAALLWLSSHATPLALEHAAAVEYEEAPTHNLGLFLRRGDGDELWSRPWEEADT
jgi:hypothetical protein